MVKQKTNTILFLVKNKNQNSFFKTKSALMNSLCYICYQAAVIF